MELRHIRYFLAVAEERNFTRAAARVGIGQPPLSQQIRDLEEEIGTRLFHRVPHGAELTEAGHAFLAAVTALPDRVAAAVRDAQRAGRGDAGVLRIGFTGSAAINPLVPRCIREFRERHRDVELLLSESNSTGLAAALKDGSIDLAFLRPGAILASETRCVDFPAEPMVLAIADKHPSVVQSQGGAIALATLNDESFIMTPRGIGPTLFDAMIEACAAVGFVPRLGPAAPQIASIVSLVAAGEGVSIVPASMRQLCVEGVAYREIADASPVAQLVLAYPRNSRSVTARRFVNKVTGILARQDG